MILFPFIEMDVWKCTNHVQWQTNHVKDKVKSTITAGTSRLIKWIYKERYKLLLLQRKQHFHYGLQTTKRKILSC